MVLKPHMHTCQKLALLNGVAQPKSKEKLTKLREQKDQGTNLMTTGAPTTVPAAPIAVQVNQAPKISRKLYSSFNQVWNICSRAVLKILESSG